MHSQCPNCGGQADNDATFCKTCGAALVGSAASTRQPFGLVGVAVAAAAVAQRTDSKIVQVAPDCENDKIREMGMFGWNLQGRQEMHEEGNAYGRASFLDSSTYVIKTKVFHYVKLHFARNLSLPNLEKITALENEYFSLSFTKPPGIAFPVCFTIFGVLGGLSSIEQLASEGLAGITLMAVFAIWITLGIRWITSRKKQRADAEIKNSNNVIRLHEITRELASLT